MRPMSPERRNGLADCGIAFGGIRINIAGVLNLALCVRIDAVNCVYMLEAIAQEHYNAW